MVSLILYTFPIQKPFHRRQTDCKCVFEQKTCQKGRRQFATVNSHLFYSILVMCHKQDAAVQVAPGPKLQPGVERQRSTKLGKPPTPGLPDASPGAPPPPAPSSSTCDNLQNTNEIVQWRRKNDQNAMPADAPPFYLQHCHFRRQVVSAPPPIRSSVSYPGGVRWPKAANWWRLAHIQNAFIIVISFWPATRRLR